MEREGGGTNDTCEDSAHGCENDERLTRDTAGGREREKEIFVRHVYFTVRNEW